MGTLNNRCRIIIGTQKGTIVFATTAHGAWRWYDQGYHHVRSSHGLEFKVVGSGNQESSPPTGRCLAVQLDLHSAVHKVQVVQLLLEVAPFLQQQRLGYSSIIRFHWL